MQTRVEPLDLHPEAFEPRFTLDSLIARLKAIKRRLGTGSATIVDADDLPLAFLRVQDGLRGKEVVLDCCYVESPKDTLRRRKAFYESDARRFVLAEPR